MRTNGPNQKLVEQMRRKNPIADLPDFGLNLYTDERYGQARFLDLRDLDFTGEDFSHWQFFGCEFSGGNLSRASFSNADMTGSRFVGSNMTGCDLTAARFWAADLTEADLSASVVYLADFQNAYLSSTKFEKAKVFGTRFIDVDLSEAVGLGSIEHKGPSVIDFETLLRSGGRLPLEFLRGCGIDPLIQSIHVGDPHSKTEAFTQWVSNANPLQRCFISYATEDERFVKRLQTALNRSGVDYWYAPKHGEWGNDLQLQIDREISLRDRMLLVCSKTSLTKDWVIHEIDRAIENEKARNQRIIFPIMIDDALEKWTDPRKSRIWKVLAADFRGATKGHAFVERMERLLGALRREGGSKPV